MKSKYFFLIIFFSILTTGCSNSMGWSSSEKNIIWESCEMMIGLESVPDDYCQCYSERITTQLRPSELEEVGQKLIAVGFDPRKLPNTSYFKKYKDVIRSCSN